MDDLIFEQGFAIGQSDIRGDCLHFRFENEFFVVKDRSLKTETIEGRLVAKVVDVRKLADGVKHG